MEWRRGEYTISTERTRIDVDFVHEFLTRSYWAKNISRELTLRSIDHSLPFGLFCGGRQVGFSRVITDYATFGYLGDVFVLEKFRDELVSNPGAIDRDGNVWPLEKPGLGLEVNEEFLLKHPPIEGPGYV